MTHMTLGAEISLPVHLDVLVSYSQLETALLDAGFTDYTIMRTVNPDASCEVQIFVRSPIVNNQQEALPAVETLQALTDACTALEAEEASPV